METLSSTNQLSAHPTSIDWTIGHTESAAQLIKEEEKDKEFILQSNAWIFLESSCQTAYILISLIATTSY